MKCNRCKTTMYCYEGLDGGKYTYECLSCGNSVSTDCCDEDSQMVSHSELNEIRTKPKNISAKADFSRRSLFGRLKTAIHRVGEQRLYEMYETNTVVEIEDFEELLRGNNGKEEKELSKAICEYMFSKDVGEFQVDVKVTPNNSKSKTK